MRTSKFAINSLRKCLSACNILIEIIEWGIRSLPRHGIHEILFDISANGALTGVDRISMWNCSRYICDEIFNLCLMVDGARSYSVRRDEQSIIGTDTS